EPIRLTHPTLPSTERRTLNARGCIPCQKSLLLLLIIILDPCPLRATEGRPSWGRLGRASPGPERHRLWASIGPAAASGAAKAHRGTPAVGGDLPSVPTDPMAKRWCAAAGDF